jgi:glucose-1-phosphate adenylyltransferase
MRPINILPMILAGGVGERLYPLTSNRCKPAVPFGGNFKIIDFTLMNCVCSGLRRIHVLTQYHAQSLNRHRIERWNFLSSELGEYIEMVPPKMRAATNYYQGTADAIFRNLDLLDRHRPDVVLVLSGDHVYRADYRRFIDAHLEREADVTVLTDWMDAKLCSSFGVLIRDASGRITGFIEKPPDPMPYAQGGKCLINLGVYCFQTTFLVQQLIRDAKRKTPHDFGRNILPASVGQAAVLSCPLEVVCPDQKPYWRDVGNIDSYFEANMDLLKNPSAFDLTDPRWAPNSTFHGWVPALCSSMVEIGSRKIQSRSIVSSGVRIDDSRVANSVIGPRVKIGRGCELEECILFQGAEIGEGTQLRHVIVEEGVRVPPGMRIGFGGDSCQFLTSPGGVVVISSSYRFTEAEEGTLDTETLDEGREERAVPRRRKSASQRSAPVVAPE